MNYDMFRTFFVVVYLLDLSIILFVYFQLNALVLFYSLVLTCYLLPSHASSLFDDKCKWLIVYPIFAWLHLFVCLYIFNLFAL